MNAARRALQTTVGAVFTLGVVALSRVPWAAEPSDTAIVRLAWRYRSALVDQCRTLTPAELAERPAHMRREQECERRLRPYVLQLEIDGHLVLRDSVAARGARSDRPLAVFRELRRAPGPASLRLTFEPAAHDGDAGAPPARFALDTAVVLRPRQVLLITMDENGTALSVTTSPADGAR